MKLTVHDGLSVELSLDVHAWNFIKDIKDKLQDKLGVPAVRQRLFYAGHELKNTRTLNDCSIEDGGVIFLASATAERGAFDFISVYGDVPCPPEITECIAQARRGLAIGLTPRLALEGTGGTYFLRNCAKQSVAVFKPDNEEAFMPANPRGYVGQPGQAGFRHGLLSGEGGVREVAAYMLDHSGAGHAAVPPTSRVEMSIAAFTQSPGAGGKRLSNGLTFGFNNRPTSVTGNTVISPSFSGEKLPSLLLAPAQSAWTEQETKIGSLQCYVEFQDMAGDVDYKQFPVHEVHKIAILDIRLFNIDRNEANLLVQRRWPQPPSNAASETETDTGSVSSLMSQSQLSSSSTVLFSPPNIGPSHLHHTDNDSQNYRSALDGFSSFSPPFKGLTFSPDVSPALGSNHALDSPSLTPSTILSPDVDVDLPSAATFNLNHPPMQAMSDHRSALDDSRMGGKRTAAIPIPIPKPRNPNRSGSTLAPAVTNSPLSSSVPNPPSRLQLRLQALKAARSNAATVKPTLHLVPIDHANILPDTVNLSDIEWCWINWPQVHEPLSAELKQWVMDLDVKADLAMLRSKLSIREECLKVMRISNLWLRKGVENDLTLYEIASLICRSNIDKPSQLEILCAQAATLARSIKDNVKRRNSRDKGSRTQQTSVNVSPRGKHASHHCDDGGGVAETTTNIPLLTSAPTSPISSSESASRADASEMDESRVQPRSSPLARLLALSARSKQQSSVSPRSRLSGASRMEECKLDEEGNPSKPLTASPLSALSRNLAAVKSNTLPLTRTATHDRVNGTITVAVTSESSVTSKPTLTRSSSLDLILRRSISFDNFRAVKVKKSGFGTAQISMLMGATAEGSDEDSDGDDSPSSSDEDSGSGGSDDNHSSPQSSAPANGTTRPRMHSHASQLNGAAYQVGRVFHMNGEIRKGKGWNDEAFAQLFFSCLSGLMDTHVQRMKASKARMLSLASINTATASTGSGSGSDSLRSESPLLAPLGSSPMNSLEALHASLRD